MSVLHNIFFFIVAIGILVTFHEFGHYWVARKLGVKVLRFSIGFGRPLIGWRRGKGDNVVEYVIAAIPLGGYVKMLDEREGEVSEHEKNRAFNNQPLISRAAIVVAGPVFNFILAIIFYWAILVSGTTVERPLLGEPEVNTVAEKSGFQLGDEVLKVGDTDVQSWNEFRMAILDHGLDGGDVTVIVRDGNDIEQQRNLRLGELKLLKLEGDIVADIGLRYWIPELPAVVSGVLKDTPAQRAGLKKADIIKTVNDTVIKHWGQMVEIVRQNPDKPLQFVIERDHIEISITITPDAKKINDKTVGQIGASHEIPSSIRDKFFTHIEYNAFEALPHAVGQTWDMSILMLRVLGKMLVGDASLKNISGPITIAGYAGVTAKIGLTTFLGFLALISVSLGVLNLLPIPMLDGGHLLYYLIELVKGSPVSEAFELRGQQIGIIILTLLMSVALFNDLQRLLQ